MTSRGSSPPPSCSTYISATDSSDTHCIALTMGAAHNHAYPWRADARKIKREICVLRVFTPRVSRSDLSTEDNFASRISQPFEDVAIKGRSSLRDDDEYRNISRLLRVSLSLSLADVSVATTQFCRPGRNQQFPLSVFCINECGAATFTRYTSEDSIIRVLGKRPGGGGGDRWDALNGKSTTGKKIKALRENEGVASVIAGGLETRSP